MKLIIQKNILLGLLLMLGSTNTFAKPALPVSKQATQQTTEKVEKVKKIEIVPEIKIQAQAATPSTNPKLKEGNACSDEHLEEVQGKLFTEIPMAETIPCAEVDCKDLKPAKMHKDNYVKLKTAKTISCHK